MSDEVTTKTCPSCLLVKNLSEFKYKYRHCYECQKKMSNDWKARHKEKVAEYNKKYKAENKEVISEYNAKYNIENRETIQKRTNANHYRLSRENPSFKISRTLRSRINSALKREIKCDHTLTILGCSIQFFLTWLEYCFKEDMTLQNHGTLWHIDHTVPCSKFNLVNEEEQKQCFHWTNMKPMYAKDNISKNNNHTLEEFNEHQKNIKSFLDKYSDNWKGKYTLLENIKSYL